VSRQDLDLRRWKPRIDRSAEEEHVITLTNDQARIVAHHLRERAQTRSTEEYAQGVGQLLERVADELDAAARASELAELDPEIETP
jgi:hypothetical protein